MPELPEVEAARRAIADHCIGRKIKRSVISDDTKVIDAVLPSDFEASLLGKTIVAAHRKGKNMWLELDSPPFPSFQFGMAGAIYIKGVAVTKYKRSAVSDTDEWPSKYSKLFIELDDGLEFSFTDKRRFARVRLLKDPASVPPISDLGPDALLEPMTIDELVNSLSKKKIGIKALLLDQGYISGIGNWIADEVLYQARIHPLHVAASLSRENCEALHKCIKEVIQYAVEVDAECSLFPCEWLFHFRWGKKLGTVNGKKIDFITAGGRTTAYVPELQKLPGTQAAIGPSKPQRQAFKKGKDKNGEKDVDKSGEEENAKSAKSKGKKNTTSRGHKESPVKRKFNGSNTDDDDNDISDDDDDDEGDVKKNRASKKPPAKRKSKGSGNDNNNKNGDQKKEARGRKKPPAKKKPEESDGDHDNSGDDYHGDEGGDRKETGKVMKNKQTKAEKSSKRKIRN
ncbi:formamidopyrimidine-DNA glycosylase isoform X2 [Cornus florida]|uniref:formamidopyrimidine-DNA glycosylase isoform X2 n=1 Tax=Cornus florida TaxID=4283 RepID=UPI0028A2D158|nr:formamidopyrimidine-DNA glycosylase isoform X2 [Cornus florida]